MIKLRTVFLCLVGIGLLSLGTSLARSNPAEIEIPSSSYRVGRSPELGSPLATLKIFRKHNRIFLPIEDDSGQRHLMLLDSGSTTTVFFDQPEEPSEQDLNSIPIYFPVLDIMTRGYPQKDFTFKIGEQKVKPHIAASVAQDIRLKVEPEMEFQGLIGRQLFEDYIVEINMPAGELSIWPHGSDLSKGFEASRTVHNSEGRPVIELPMELPWQRRAKSQKLMVDTGYPGTMVFWRTSKFDRIIHRLTAENTRGKLFAMVSDLGFSGIKLKSAPSFVMERTIHASDQDGIVGMAFLAMFHIAIDMRGGKMWINRLESRTFNKSRSMELFYYVPIPQRPLLVNLSPKVLECVRHNCLKGTGLVFRKGILSDRYKQ